MFPGNLPFSTIYNIGDVGMPFIEHDYVEPSGVQKEKPKTWQEKVDKERDDNLRGLFGYD